MLEFVLEELSAGDAWRNVLAAYQRRDTEPKQPPNESDGWLPRVASIAGVDPAQLSQVHGRLIALGYLKFDVSGKSGMQYQLSPLGRQTLSRGLPACPEPDPAGDAEASTAD